MIEELSGDFFQQLRGFYYVAQLGSMGQAAKVMHRSQSSVSRLVKQLEQSLGITLFSRVQKGVVLTAEGQELFKQSVEIFEKIRSVHSELSQNANMPSGAVSLMTSQVAFMHFVENLLPELRHTLPGISLNIKETIAIGEAMRQLEERVLDLAFIVGGDTPAHLEFVPLFTTNMVLAVPKQVSIAQKDLLAWKLPDLPFIQLPDQFGFARYVDHHLGHHGLHIKKTVLAENMYFQLAMAAAGFGMVITHEAALGLAKKLPLRSYSLGHLLPPQVYGLTYLKNSYMTPQARAVIDFFKAHSMHDTAVSASKVRARQLKK